MTKTSTDYYRENKLLKRVVHKCHHCSYETTGPKIALKHHIDAKHKTDSERPFQCMVCSRGFAQKSHLINHCMRIHDIKLEINKQIGLLYSIQPTNNIPSSKKTKARYNYYKKNPIIKSTKIKNLEYESINNIFLKTHDINYDLRNGYITVVKTPLYKKL